LVYSKEITRRYIPEGSHLHTLRLEKLKSHNIKIDIEEICFGDGKGIQVTK
jgi:hypothetical protein